MHYQIFHSFPLVFSFSFRVLSTTKEQHIILPSEYTNDYLFLKVRVCVCKKKIWYNKNAH